MRGWAADSEDGYLAVDALVALVITTMALVVVISASSTGRKSAQRALLLRSQMTEAQLHCDVALNTTRTTDASGWSSDHTLFWRVDLGPRQPLGLTGFCRVDCSASTKDGHVFQLRTLKLCSASATQP